MDLLTPDSNAFGSVGVDVPAPAFHVVISVILMYCAQFASLATK